jgi:CRISPR type I-E-associated protein CasB/Cse2
MEKNSFIDALYNIADNAERDRAPIAQIKKGASDPANNDFAVLRYLNHSIPINEQGNFSRDYIVLATIFVLFPTKKIEADNAVSWGELFKRVKFSLGPDGSKSFELRVNRILKAHEDDLPNLLASMARYLKSFDVGKCDYYRLLSDLRNWNNPDEFVQKRWAKEFWCYQEKEVENSIIENNNI